MNENCDANNSDKINSRTVAGTTAIPRGDPVTMSDTSSWEGVTRASLGGDYTHQEMSMTSSYPCLSPLHDSAILAVVRPGEGGLHGCVGQSGALDRLVGVVGGGCMGRFQTGYHDSYFSRTQALPNTHSSYWGTSSWVTCGSATTISHSSSSVTWPWRTEV